jgi:hypothetical protein
VGKRLNFTIEIKEIQGFPTHLKNPFITYQLHHEKGEVYATDEV